MLAEMLRRSSCGDIPTSEATSSTRAWLRAMAATLAGSLVRDVNVALPPEESGCPGKMIAWAWNVESSACPSRSPTTAPAATPSARSHQRRTSSRAYRPKSTSRSASSSAAAWAPAEGARSRAHAGIDSTSGSAWTAGILSLGFAWPSSCVESSGRPHRAPHAARGGRRGVHPAPSRAAARSSTRSSRACRSSRTRTQSPNVPRRRRPRRSRRRLKARRSAAGRTSRRQPPLASRPNIRLGLRPMALAGLTGKVLEYRPRSAMESCTRTSAASPLPSTRRPARRSGGATSRGQRPPRRPWTAHASSSARTPARSPRTGARTEGPLAPQGAGEGRVVADRGRRGGVLRHDRGPSLRRMVEVGTRQVGIQRLGTDQLEPGRPREPRLHLNVRRLDLLRAEGQRTRALHDVRLRNALQMESFYATPSSDGRRLFTISRAGRAVAVSAFMWQDPLDAASHQPARVLDAGRGQRDGVRKRVRRRREGTRASDGRLLWERFVPGRILAGGLLVGNLLFVSTLEKKTYALLRENGRVVWRLAGKVQPRHRHRPPLLLVGARLADCLHGRAGPR